MKTYHGLRGETCAISAYEHDASRLRDLREQLGFPYAADVVAWVLDVATQTDIGFARQVELLQEQVRQLNTKLDSPYRDG